MSTSNIRHFSTIQPRCEIQTWSLVLIASFNQNDVNESRYRYSEKNGYPKKGSSPTIAIKSRLNARNSKAMTTTEKSAQQTRCRQETGKKGGGGGGCEGVCGGKEDEAENI